MFTVLYDLIIHGREHVVNADADAVSVYCVLALYVPPYIIKLATSTLKIGTPTDIGTGPPGGSIQPCMSLTLQS